MKATIKYTNLKKLEPSEQEIIKEKLQKELNKFSRLIKNNLNVSVHPKLYNKEKRKRYTINLKINSPAKTFTAETSEWDLNTAINKTIIKVENQIKKIYKLNKRSLLKLKIQRLFKYK